MRKFPFLVSTLAAALAAAGGGLSLGTPFADHAVLQRDRPVPVWGTAAPGAAVKVSFAGREKAATAGANGAWRVTLDPMPASREPRTLAVSTADSRLDIRDVLVGEVWFASGQSNMDCPLWLNGHTRYRERNGGLMTEMTHLPLIRFAGTPCSWSVTTNFYAAEWYPMTHEVLASRGLSAVAFYYARELYLALGVPVGIVIAAWGGTNIDAWTPRCGYADCDPSIRDTADYVPRPTFDPKKDKLGPVNWENQQPTVLFNGKVAAWAPMAMRGFIWYQGCHNAGVGESDRYCAKMHALYNGWSRAFDNPSLKLYFAQLAPCGNGFLRVVDQQNRFAAEEKNAAIAVLSDVGNTWDIHPNDKETVAQRLVVHALKRDYGFAISEDDSPVFRSASVTTNGQMVLAFDHVTDWYVYAPNHSKEVPFEVAGTNGVWKKAKIVNFRSCPPGRWTDEYRIDSPELVIASKEVAEPVVVRYMASGETGTLYSQVSLPLGPFVASADGEGAWNAARRLVEPSGGEKRPSVAQNLAWLEAGRISTNSVGSVIRWLEARGVDCRSYRKLYGKAD